MDRRRFLLWMAASPITALGGKGVWTGLMGVVSSPIGINFLRPPGAVPEPLFPSKCIRCGRCVEVCPYRSIRPLDIRFGVHAGTPAIRVNEIPCYLCMKCVEVCPTGTLRPISMRQTRMGLAEVDKHRCITWLDQGLCRTCYNICPLKQEAIVLDQLRPVVVEERCTGCGVCVHGCPIEGPGGRKAINCFPIYSGIGGVGRA